jgi:hypothetical protein
MARQANQDQAIQAGGKALLFNSRVWLFGHGKLHSKWIIVQSPSSVRIGIHSRLMANALNYSLSQILRILRKWMSRFPLVIMITSIGLRDLNSIVINRLGFPFSKIFFQNFQNK